MLCWILIVGGLLIMMGQHDRSEALFYYFRLEDQVPETHLLRLIDKHISFAFVREKLKESYSEGSRPSIDPELLLRILLIGYLYGITSERKLVEELRMHLAWRWFTGLGFDQEIPHHSTFSKNRDAHRWFELRESIGEGPAPGFYVGAVACAFNHLQRCEKELATVIESRPKSDDAIEAHRLLGAAYLRQGRYREALVQVDALLALRPGDSDVSDDRPLLVALSEFPDQQIMRRRSTTVKLQDAGLPISINGVKATYWRRGSAA
jgi:transposase